MNFTRDPIIETIISSKEGGKLLVRNSKNRQHSEEYYVDAVEVVSFGHAFFFRSLERPQAFLVPASDYEIMEVKEARVALKAAPHERSIKIGGGREAPVRSTPREIPPEEAAAPLDEAAPRTDEEYPPREKRGRDRRRRRHRGRDDQEWARRPQEEAPKTPEEAVKAPPVLIPPPLTLISETLSRYKDKEFMGKPFLPKEAEAVPESHEEPPAEADSTSLSRSSVPSDQGSYFF